jgi:hypothetical protein
VTDPDPRGLRWPELGLEVAPSAALAGHLRAEYGPPSLEPSEPSRLVVRGLRPDEVGADRVGRHKTTRWRIRLSEPAWRPILVEVAIRGVFGSSLVQSLVIEPLLTMAAAEAGELFLSAGAVQTEHGSIALAGVSRSGKSTLALRAWAGGLPVIADDRLRIAPDGLVRPFPRRLRIYPDVRTTAVQAFDRLPRRVRLELRLLGATRRLSGGRIALPALVDRSVVVRTDSPTPLAAVYLIDRVADPAPDALVVHDDPADGRRLVRSILEGDARWLAGVSAGWREATTRSVDRQLDLFDAALQRTGADLRIVRVPERWSAARAVAAVAAAIGLP